METKKGQRTIVVTENTTVLMIGVEWAVIQDEFLGILIFDFFVAEAVLGQPGFKIEFLRIMIVVLLWLIQFCRIQLGEFLKILDVGRLYLRRIADDLGHPVRPFLRIESLGTPAPIELADPTGIEIFFINRTYTGDGKQP
jgi:hypothetical protein